MNNTQMSGRLNPEAQRQADSRQQTLNDFIRDGLGSKAIAAGTSSQQTQSIVPASEVQIELNMLRGAVAACNERAMDLIQRLDRVLLAECTEPVKQCESVPAASGCLHAADMFDIRLNVYQTTAALQSALNRIAL